MATINGNSELAGKIIKILGLPKRTVNFSMHFPLDGAVTVECAFYPEETDGSSELPLLFEEYQLEKIEEVDDGNG